MQVVSALKAFAPVKDAHLAVNPATNASLRACYVEFQSVEHARHTLETVAKSEETGDHHQDDNGHSGGGGGGGGGDRYSGLTIDGDPASLSYAATGAPPASAAPAIAAAAAAADADEDGEEEEGRILPPVSTSSLTALKAFQGRQNAARLAKLEGAASETATAAATAAPARARRARVDTGSGAGMGSLALAFAPGEEGGGGRGRGAVGGARGYGDAGSSGGAGAMAVVTLGGLAGSEGASPEVSEM